MQKDLIKPVFFKKLTAFTIAEILIVLGIIGIVVVITLPSVFLDVQEHKLRNAAKEVFSRTNQAVNLMRTREGGTLIMYPDKSGSHDTKFEPFFIQSFEKVLKDCGVSAADYCGESSYNWYKTLSGQNANYEYYNEGKFITHDGVFFAINDSYGPFNGTDGNSKYIYITVDVNGYKSGPNIFGRDVFMFQILDDVLIPMGAPGTDFANGETLKYCDRKDASEVGSTQGFGCMDLVMQNISY